MPSSWTRSAAQIALALTLTGCALTTTATDVSCVAFQIIKLSRSDVLTAGTEREIAKHNAAWEALCR